MKIPKVIPEYVIRKQITALEQTLEEYNNGTHEPNVDDCKLCQVAMHVNSRRSDDIIRSEYLFSSFGSSFYNSYCRCCPWFWITNKTCMQRYKNLSVLNQVNDGDEDIINKRKLEIRRWIKQLRDYLNK